MITRINFIFIGGTFRGFKLITELLAEGYKPTHVFILKEDPHEEMQYSDEIMKICELENIPWKKCKKLNDNDYSILQKGQWDFGIICGWRTIIKPEIASQFTAGLIAAHDSLLPQYRGFAPINWAIINGEKKVGVSLFQITDGEVDSGPIISQKVVEVDKDDYAIDVYKKITDATIYVFRKFIKDYKENRWSTKNQDENMASYTCKRTPHDGKIDWTRSSSSIYNLIRGLAFPYPGAYCNYEGNIYHIRKCSFGVNDSRNYVGRIPGRIISISEAGVEVLCGEGSILIEEWENKDLTIIENPNRNIKSISKTIQ